MVKLSRKTESGEKIVQFPDNLLPTVFKCLDCGSTIRRLEETDSFILMSTSKEVEDGTKKICPFCYRLREYRGIE
jgi:hypothetical protein